MFIDGAGTVPHLPALVTGNGASEGGKESFKFFAAERAHSELLDEAQLQRQRGIHRFSVGVLNLRQSQKRLF